MKVFLVLIISLMTSAVTHAATVSVNMDGAVLNDNGVTYFIDPEIWVGDATLGGTNGATLLLSFSNINPTIVGYPAAANDFSSTIWLGGVDGINTSGEVVSMMPTNSTSIPGVVFSYSIGSYSLSSSWDWIGYDLIFQTGYSLAGISKPDQFGSYSFTIENYFATEAPAAVPAPAAVWLFGSGILGLVGIARRKKA